MSRTLSQLHVIYASGLTRTASEVLRPTRAEYEQSFGEKLSDLCGRCRWHIAGNVASLWPGLPDTGLRDTIQEALKSPEKGIYKGMSVRQDILLECYMIGYSQACAHPTIAICHPVQAVLARSVKVISTFVKQASYYTLA